MSKNKRKLTLKDKWHRNLIFERILSTCHNNFEKVLIFLINFLSNPFFSGFILIVQLAAGAILGANISILFTGNVFGSNLTIDSTIKLISQLNQLTIFSVCFAFSITLLRAFIDTIQKNIDDKIRKKENEELKSLPDSLWIKKYHTETIPTIMSINESLTISGENGKFDDTEITKDIKTLLEISKKMAQEWDSSTVEKYSANLMIYLPSSDVVNGYIKKYWDTNKRFFDGNSPDNIISQISGILIVIASSNKKTSFYGRNKNTENNPLILPVCIPSDDADSCKFLSKQSLPGAPEAYKTASPHYLKDLPTEVSKWLNHDYWRYFNDQQSQEIYEYYINDHTVRSLISMPISCSKDIILNNAVKFKENELIAVLNIYCIEKNMLRGNYSTFYEFSRPILTSMANALAAYEIWNESGNE